MTSQLQKLIIVKRGKQGAFGMLNGWLKEAGDVQVIWDRRVGDRRQLGEATFQERRETERRRPLAPTWNVFMPQAHDAWSVLFFAAVKATRAAERPAT